MSLEDIKQRWDEIADLLPSKGDTVPSMSIGSIAFRYKFDKERGERDLKMLEEKIKNGEFPKGFQVDIDRVRKGGLVLAKLDDFEFKQ